MSRMIWTAGLLLCCSFAAFGGDEEKGAPLIPGVQVVLRCDIARLDPRAPGKHEIECIVKNGSDKPIVVPVGYDGGFSSHMELIAMDHRWPLSLVAWAAPKKQTKVALKPGEEVRVFRDTLRAVLLLDVKEEIGKPPLIPGEKRYYWSWIA